MLSAWTALHAYHLVRGRVLSTLTTLQSPTQCTAAVTQEASSKFCQLQAHSHSHKVCVRVYVHSSMRTCVACQLLQAQRHELGAQHAECVCVCVCLQSYVIVQAHLHRVPAAAGPAPRAGHAARRRWAPVRVGALPCRRPPR